MHPHRLVTFACALLLVVGAVFVVCVSGVELGNDDSDVDVGAMSSETVAATLTTAPLATAPFNVYDYLNGEWQVYRHLVNYKTGATSYEHALPVVHWKLEKENNTANLIGRAFVNTSLTTNVGGATEDLALFVKFDDPASGVFQTGVDDDSFATLFGFSFTQGVGSVPISVGRWNGAEVPGDVDATYLFQASSPDRFTITVTPRKFNLAKASVPLPPLPQAKKSVATSESADEDEDATMNGPASTGHPLLSVEDLGEGESFLYIGHRVKVEPEKTFFQKYGTMIMLAGMLILNVYMRTKQSSPASMAGLQTARAQVNASGAAVGGAKRPSGARIEEITESSKDK